MESNPRIEKSGDIFNGCRTLGRRSIRSTSHFFIDSEQDIACNLHIAQRPLTKGVLFAPSDTDVTGDVRKSRSRPSATNHRYPWEERMKTRFKCPSRIGNQLCFADPCPTNKQVGSTTT